MRLFDIYRKNREKSRRREVEQLFQLREYDGEIWLTYGGCLVCPCSMLNDEPVSAVRKIRELYMRRDEDMTEHGSKR